MVMAQIQLTDYTNRVLNVIKARFGLGDKSEALNKFAELYGDEFVEREADDEYARKVLEICDRHLKAHPKRRMTLKELDALCER